MATFLSISPLAGRIDCRWENFSVNGNYHEMCLHDRLMDRIPSRRSHLAQYPGTSLILVTFLEL